MLFERGIRFMDSIQKELDRAKAKYIEHENRLAAEMKAMQEKYDGILCYDDDDEGDDDALEMMLDSIELGWRDIRTWDCLGDILNRQRDLVLYINKLASGIDDDGNWLLFWAEKFIKDCEEDIQKSKEMISAMNDIVSVCKKLREQGKQAD